MILLKKKKQKTKLGGKKKESRGKFFGLWILLPGEMGLKPHLIAKTWSDSLPRLLPFFPPQTTNLPIGVYFTLPWFSTCPQLTSPTFSMIMSPTYLRLYLPKIYIIICIILILAFIV